MSRFIPLNKKTILLAAIGLLLLSGSLAWLERAALLSWCAVYQLARADDSNRAAWAERVAGLGEDTVAGLLDGLRNENPSVCRNMHAGLAQLSGKWGTGDARTTSVALLCGREFGRFSPSGRQQVLELAAEWFRETPAEAPPASGLLPACVHLLAEAAADTDPETQVKALALCEVLLAQPGTEALSASRELVRRCLSSDSAANRLSAVRLALNPGMDLFEQVATLLNDKVVEVRRAALIAVGPEKNIIEELLLPSLHDADPQVRRLCESALANDRKFTPQKIRLGFYLTAPDPVVRIHVVEQLEKVPDVDTAAWLERISHDSSPAIRAAAARAMSRQNMTELLEKMAHTDSSATVCLLARYYLEHAESGD